MPKVRVVVLFAQDRLESRPLSLKSLRMGELQMDWLRSEDLKEVKVATAPWLSIAVEIIAG
jgi:hypothetical protein